MQRCGELGAPPWAADALERLESLASRFARLSDLLTQRVMRLADDIELEAPGSLLDRIHRAEKRGWAGADGELVRIRELRNLMAHEYEDEDLDALYGEVQRLAPSLVSAARRAALWAASAAAGAPEGAR
jgi:hypothetical protein